MIAVGSATLARDTRHHRVLENGFSFHRSEWMQTGSDPHLSPTIFLVEQPPHSVLPTHFHTQNQFQVFKQGSGSLGSRAVGPGSVHYAGAFTGYGPLVAGPQGLSYFTIRAVFETGASFLPIARDKLRRGPKRHAHGPAHPPRTPELLRSLTAPVRVELIEGNSGDPEAFALQLPPFSELRVPAARGLGQFQLVLAGELNAPERRLQQWESRFLSTGEHGGACNAGPQGLHLLVLQVPVMAAEYLPGR
ncbi:hypothetical protein [Cupriavidus consociatus]|uniref:hypothetical protein n=1 Tax=Cupriavidus consociatus TaxID=2821357 RepID=UPI001AE58188|nr:MULTISPECIES: hypothetical protein [unclassified Cupriavidus]MBP0624063.1 hypothetical protein [Cupriavidus sp. LEh25]MDK2660772.1 hypothetical protein [Cupriavidus sp. LEh21]